MIFINSLLFLSLSTLGGLGGIPFAGKSGFGAYLHHVPDSGKLLVFFAPHVGIDSQGKIGSLQRDGQATVSSACGAAIGAYKALQTKKSTPEDPLLTFDNLQKEDVDTKFDPQLDQIIKKGNIIIEFLPQIKIGLDKKTVLMKVEDSIEKATNKLLD